MECTTVTVLNIVQGNNSDTEFQTLNFGECLSKIPFKMPLRFAGIYKWQAHQKLNRKQSFSSVFFWRLSSESFRAIRAFKAFFLTQNCLYRRRKFARKFVWNSIIFRWLIRFFSPFFFKVNEDPENLVSSINRVETKNLTLTNHAALWTRLRSVRYADVVSSSFMITCYSIQAVLSSGWYWKPIEDNTERTSQPLLSNRR